MKTFTKVLSLFIVLLMVVGCVSGCVGKIKPESVTDKDAVKEYNKIKSDLDKLFYGASSKHPAASNVTALVDLEALTQGNANAVKPGNNQEMSVNASVGKLVVEEADLLKQLGGSLAFNGTAIKGKDGMSLDLGATVSGLTVDFDVDYTDDAFVVNCPFIFTKPVYYDVSSLFDMTGHSSELAVNYALNINKAKITEDLEKWYTEKLGEENQRYLAELLKGCVSADAITVSKETPDELKGNYISFDTKTECVTLTITEDVAKQFVETLGAKVKEDKVVKDIVISFLNCFGDDLLKLMTEKTAEELYNEFVDSFDELKKEVFSESSEDSADADSSDDADGKNERIVVRRYFAGGHCVKNDLVIEDDEEKYLEFTYWDVYANTNAREYGVKLNVEGENWLTAIGGANGTDADISVSFNVYEEGVEVSSDKAEEKTEKVADIKLTAKRSKEGFTANGNINATEDSLKASFEYTNSESVNELKIDASATDFAGKIEYKKNADATSFKADITADEYKIDASYTGIKAGGTLKASIAEGDKVIVSYDGDLTVIDNKATVDADIVIEQDGESVTYNCLAECIVKVEGSKVEYDMDYSITAEKLFELELDLKLGYDQNSSKAPEEPSKDGAYVIDSEDDLDGAEDLLTEAFKALMDEISGNDYTGNYPDYGEIPEITDDVDERMLGYWVCEYEDYSIFYIFRNDQSGVSGYDNEVDTTLFFCSNAEDSTISVVEYKDGELYSYFEGTYIIIGNKLTIFAYGEQLTLTKMDLSSSSQFSPNL